MKNHFVKIKNEIVELFPRACFFDKLSKADLKVLRENSIDSIAQKLFLHEYMSAFYEDTVENLSFYIKHNNSIVFFMPLYLKISDQSSTSIFSFDEKLNIPIVSSCISSKERGEFFKNFAKFLTFLIKALSLRSTNLELPQNIDPSLIEVISERFDFRDLYFRLEYHVSDEVNIQVTKRKSYRNLVNKGTQSFDISVVQDCGWDDFEELKDLHFKVSGRITRPIMTWRLMHEWVLNGHAYVVTGRDRSGELAGYALFSRQGDSYSYASAAYMRSSNNEGLSHAIMSRAIHHLPSLGAKNLILGLKDPNEKNEKIASINHFKAGFSNYTTPIVILVAK